MESKSPVKIEVPCPVCEHPRWRPYVMAPSHYGPEKHPVTQCEVCGMVYTNPQTQTYLTEVENRGALNNHLTPEAVEARLSQSRFLLHLITKYTDKRDLLDFGCGIGALIHLAVKDGWNAIGYDLNRGLVEASNKHWNFDAIKTGPTEEFYASHQNAFDAIVSFQVFEHLQQPLDVGAKVVSMLRPGGVILIDVPNVNQPGEWFSKGKTLDPTSHWCHFSTRTLGDLVRRLGCDVVYASAAPSFFRLYHKLGLGSFSTSLGAFTKAVLPPVGTGVCVIGRKRQPA